MCLSSKNTMFNTEHCGNTVDGEIIRDQKLQKEKFKKYSNSGDYDVIDVDFERPSSSRPTNVQDISAKNLKKEYKYTNEHTKRKKQKVPKTGNRKRNGAKFPKKCPIRVLELSIPTKRQCLETWRNNQDILPDYMIERLRRMIMDERPIVQLHDAVDYFKKRKKIKPRLCTSHKIVLKPKQMEQLKTLCAILGYKIIRKLLRPININLNSELQSLSKVIYDEITIITQYSKIKPNHKIQSEIANKVTIWVASVLEDSSFLQLLVDYEELKKQEEPVWNIIDDLIENITVIDEPQIIVDSAIKLILSFDSKSSIDEHNSKTTDTEKSEKSEDDEIKNKHDFTTNDLKEVARNNEQELKGSEITESENLSQYVRDVIDEVIDAHASGVENNRLDLPIDKEDIIPKHSIQSTSNISIDQQYSMSVIDNNESEYFNNFIKDIINEILVRCDSIHNLEVTNKSDTYKEAQIKKANISTQNSQKKSVQNIENETEEINAYDIDTIDVANEIKNTENDNIVLVDYEMMESSLDIDNKQNELNDVVAALDKQEGSLDDTNKKVKFSDINIGNKRMKGININRNSNSSQESVIMQEKFKSSIDKSVKPVLYIAPPNDHLLSDADESWPENLRFPVLKASISVSKSIQSLGKIIENEEKNISSPEVSFQNEPNINENLKLSSNKSDNKLISSDTYLTIIDFERFDKGVNDSKVSNITKYKDTNITIPREYDDESNKNSVMYLKKEPQTDIKDTVKDKTKESKPSLEIKAPNSNIDIILPAIVDIEATNECNKTIFFDDIMAINEKKLTEGIVNTPNTEGRSSSITPSHINSIARLTITHLPLIKIDNICNDKLTHKKSLQTDKDDKQTIYALSKATQRSVVTERIYRSNFNPEGHHIITELKLRQWCLGLESVIENLEMWTDWIENTCTYILFLKYEGYKGRKMQQNKYKKNKLKTNIELDAKLWLKLSKNNQVGLLSYRKYYENLEVRINLGDSLKMCILRGPPQITTR